MTYIRIMDYIMSNLSGKNLGERELMFANKKKKNK